MGFRSDAANLGKLSALNCFASLNAMLPEEDERARLNFVSNVYVHEETPHSILELFKVAVAMQAANGQIWGQEIEQLFDAQSARSAHRSQVLAAISTICWKSSVTRWRRKGENRAAGRQLI